MTEANEVLPYGTWPSPVTASMLTDGVVRLIDVWVDESSGEPITVWHEGRPSEAGRQPLVVDAEGGRRDVIDAPFSARSAVHEYGGGAAWVEGGIAGSSTGTTSGFGGSQSTGRPIRSR